MTLPRKSGFDSRVAKTSESQRSLGGDGKLYMMDDRHDQQRFHILSDVELEDEKRRSMEIKDALVKSVGRSRPNSGSSSSSSSSAAASRYSTTKLPQSPVPSPVKSSQHSPSSSSRYAISSATTKTATVDHPSIRRSIEKPPTGIAERSQTDPTTATPAGLDSLKTQYEANLNVIDQLYKDKTHLEHRVKSLEFQREHPNSRAMIPGAEDLRPGNVHVIKPSATAKTSSSSASSAALSSSKTTTASSPSSSRGRPTGFATSDATRRSRERSPVATVMDALQLKHEQNVQVIEKLTEEKLQLENKARSLALVIVNGEPKDSNTPHHHHNLGVNTSHSHRFAVEGHDLEVDGDGDGDDDDLIDGIPTDSTHQPTSEYKSDQQHKSKRPQSAPTRTHSHSPGE